jgi:DNA-binding SARP family transcriptional activator
MEFRILGPFEVALGERRLALRGGRQRALVAMLAIHANEVVSKDLLIEELWPNEEFDAALNTLQVTVSRLRKALHSSGGEERLVTKPPGYLLRLAPEELDAGVFERLLGEGRADLAQGELEQALGHLQQALALWRGDALADFRYERFAQAAIARLEELRHVCLEERVEAELALGRHDALVPELEALVHDHPLRERLRSQLRLALYRCGRQEEALELYRETRNRLREEIGLEPSPELQELQRQILAAGAGPSCAQADPDQPASAADAARRPTARAEGAGSTAPQP